MLGVASCYRRHQAQGVAQLRFVAASAAFEEAEFMAAVSCAKAVKYFRSILGPTMVYGDNVACCHLANSGKPTERARHIDIQYFAIQEWTARKIIMLDHIPGRINVSDALTKALGYVLLNRHCTRMMGYAGSPYTSSANGKIVTRTSV